MTPRHQLLTAYELAFHPARLNTLWNDWEKGAITDLVGVCRLLEWALTLHQRLNRAVVNGQVDGLPPRGPVHTRHDARNPFATQASWADSCLSSGKN